MHPTEKIVRQFHESWDMRDPERGVAVIAHDCLFEDVARGESQIGPEGYKMDYERWRTAFPDGEVKVTNVLVDGEKAVVEFVNRGTHTGPRQLCCEYRQCSGTGRSLMTTERQVLSRQVIESPRRRATLCFEKSAGGDPSPLSYSTAS